MTAADWHERVEEAALSSDRVALAALYVEAQALFGDHAAQQWAQALSAFDALAVTG